MSKSSNLKTITFEAISELSLAFIHDADHASITRHDSEDSSLFIPRKFNEQQAEDYSAALNDIAKHRKQVLKGVLDFVRADAASESIDVPALLKDTERLLTPLAQNKKVTLTIGTSQLKKLCQTLLYSELKEVQNIGQQLSTLLKDTFPHHQKDYQKQIHTDLAQIVSTMEEPLSVHLQSATLIGFSIRNEMELVPYILYPYTALGFDELASEIDSWSYKQKLAVLEGYIGARTHREHIPGPALKKIQYHWEILSDYTVVRQMADIAKKAEKVTQPLSPRFGYEIPKIVEDSGMADEFEKCFDISYELYSNIQKAGFLTEAQYAALEGHKQRLLLSYDAQAAFVIHEQAGALSEPPRLRRVANAMHERLYEVHPLLASSMKFVNR